MANQSLFNTNFLVRNGADELEKVGHRRPGNNNSEADAHVAAYFRGIREAIIERINKYDMIVGCVAWLSDPPILEALAQPEKHVCIVLQKEDFLRPDGPRENFRDRIREAYGRVGKRLWYMGLPDYTSISYRREKQAINAYPQREYLWGSDDTLTIEPFRCAGTLVKAGQIKPRMHNKFLVFGKLTDNFPDNEYVPLEVWTGSYNMSFTATMGFENGVAISSDQIAKAYLKEFSDILLLSEPLDWSQEWIAPELGIGIS